MTIYIVLICLTPILLIGLYLAYSTLRSKAIARKARAAFDNVYGQRIPPPAYELSYSYGYPHFAVRFGTEEELAAADKEGLNGRFSREIEEICKNEGTRDRPFRAELGISFTSEEGERARREGYERQKVALADAINAHGPQKNEPQQRRPPLMEGIVVTSQPTDAYRTGILECSHGLALSSWIGFIFIGSFGLVIVIGMLAANYQKVFSGENGLVTLLEILVVILLMLPFSLLALAFPFMTKVMIRSDGLESHTLYYVLRTDWKNIDIVCAQGRSKGKIVQVIPRAGTLTLRKWVKPFRSMFKDRFQAVNIPVPQFGKSDGHTLEADIRAKLGIPI